MIEIILGEGPSNPPTKTIKECMHDRPIGVGLGYAMCHDCGALLPDEDPDLYDKCLSSSAGGAATP